MNPNAKKKTVVPWALAALTAGIALATPAGAQQDCFIGEIRHFGGNFAPRGWALAQGQIISINQNQALFSILGNTYGGDGRTTFGLPDLRGRTIVGPGQGPGLGAKKIGQKGGAESVTPNLTQMPSHTHAATTAVTVSAKARGHDASEGDTSSPNNTVWADSDRRPIYSTQAPDVDMSGAAIEVSATGNTTIGNTGGGQGFQIMQPFLAVNPIICLQGLYPSRN